MFIASKNSDANLKSLRSLRDKLLAATDFFYLSDTPDPPAGVHQYRQALRDCTNPPPGKVAKLPDPTAFGLPDKVVQKLQRVMAIDFD